MNDIFTEICNVCTAYLWITIALWPMNVYAHVPRFSITFNIFFSLLFFPLAHAEYMAYLSFVTASPLLCLSVYLKILINAFNLFFQWNLNGYHPQKSISKFKYLFDIWYFVLVNAKANANSETWQKKQMVAKKSPNIFIREYDFE